MKRLLSLAWLVTMAALHFPQVAQAQRAEYDALVATHARANSVPEALVHRVIVRESRYQPHLVGRGGTIGLMQIKLATARGLGYTGTAQGLRDPNTNLTYAVKYLAGAYRAANGDHSRAVHYYASGYYAAAKRQRLAHIRHPEPQFAGAPPKDAAKSPAEANAQQVPKQ
jgi:soluble lytic murein transglycosylase-like protein